MLTMLNRRGIKVPVVPQEIASLFKLVRINRIGEHPNKKLKGACAIGYGKELFIDIMVLDKEFTFDLGLGCHLYEPCDTVNEALDYLQQQKIDETDSQRLEKVKFAIDVMRDYSKYQWHLKRTKNKTSSLESVLMKLHDEVVFNVLIDQYGRRIFSESFDIIDEKIVNDEKVKKMNAKIFGKETP